MHHLDRRSFLTIATAGLCAGMFPAAALAEDPSVGDIFIGELERRIIRDYYQRHLDDFNNSSEGHEYNKHKGKKKYKGNLPPGLAKRETLPPGLQMQLERNGHLPPGLEKRGLPDDLLGRLPRLDARYRYVQLDNKVLLVQAASNLILDVLEVAALDWLD